MALVLGVVPGDIIDIADDWVIVLRVDTASKVTLQLSNGTRVPVGADTVTEILPSVYVRLGPDKTSWRVRLCFDATPDIRIRRRR
jgi:hypothetical protein